MNKRTRFFVNGSLIACTSLLLRLSGLGFSAYITQHLGAEGTGLLSLVSTVYGFGITLAVSGIFLACMRLCSAALAKNDMFGLFTAMQKSFLHAAFFGILATGVISSFAKPLGTRFLGDVRTVESIHILSIALPFIALTTVTDSYFTSVGRVYKSAISDLAEQLIKMIATVLLLKSAEPFGLQACIAAVTKGSCIGEIGAFFVSFLLYRQDNRKYRKNTSLTPSKTESLLRISLPIAFSTYARSGLVTIEHTLIPKGLQAYGNAKKDALADYGIVRGMALPIVLFPASVLSAFTGLLVPEFAQDNTMQNKQSIARKTSLSMNLACLFSVITACLLFVFGNDIGPAVYKNEKSGHFIRLFAVLIPFMYCDTTADSILKGLDKQVYTMVVNIIDAAVSVVMTGKIVPQHGMLGYIITVFTTEILNFCCSAGKLASFVKFSFRPIQSLAFPAAVTLLSAGCVKQITNRIFTQSAILRSIIGIVGSLLFCLPLCLQVAFPNSLQDVPKLRGTKKQRDSLRNPVAKKA